jgi:hypothetical protein
MSRSSSVTKVTTSSLGERVKVAASDSANTVVTKGTSPYHIAR